MDSSKFFLKKMHSLHNKIEKRWLSNLVNHLFPIFISDIFDVGKAVL